VSTIEYNISGVCDKKRSGPVQVVVEAERELIQGCPSRFSTPTSQRSKVRFKVLMG
jgi:hypothetical protein